MDTMVRGFAAARERDGPLLDVLVDARIVAASAAAISSLEMPDRSGCAICCDHGRVAQRCTGLGGRCPWLAGGRRVGASRAVRPSGRGPSRQHRGVRRIPGHASHDTAIAAGALQYLRHWGPAADEVRGTALDDGRAGAAPRRSAPGPIDRSVHPPSGRHPAPSRCGRRRTRCRGRPLDSANAAASGFASR